MYLEGHRYFPAIPETERQYRPILSGSVSSTTPFHSVPDGVQALIDSPPLSDPTDSHRSSTSIPSQPSPPQSTSGSATPKAKAIKSTLNHSVTGRRRPIRKIYAQNSSSRYQKITNKNNAIPHTALNKLSSTFEYVSNPRFTSSYEGEHASDYLTAPFYKNLTPCNRIYPNSSRSPFELAATTTTSSYGQVHPMIRTFVWHTECWTCEKPFEEKDSVMMHIGEGIWTHATPKCRTLVPPEIPWLKVHIGLPTSSELDWSEAIYKDIRKEFAPGVQWIEVVRDHLPSTCDFGHPLKEGELVGISLGGNGLRHCGKGEDGSLCLCTYCD